MGFDTQPLISEELYPDPLHYAAAAGNTDDIAVLLDDESVDDINRVNEYGRSALYIALMHGRANSAFYLLEYGADASLCDTQGNSMLVWAAQIRNDTLACELMRQGADPRIPGDPAGKNPRRPHVIAAEKGFHEVADALEKACDQAYASDMKRRPLPGVPSDESIAPAARITIRKRQP